MLSLWRNAWISSPAKSGFMVKICINVRGKHVPIYPKASAKSIRLTCMWREFWWFHDLYNLLLAQWTGFIKLVDWNIWLLNQSSAMIGFSRGNSSSVGYMGLELEVYLQLSFGGVTINNGPWRVLRKPLLQIFGIATWIKLRFTQSKIWNHTWPQFSALLICEEIILLDLSLFYFNLQ